MDGLALREVARQKERAESSALKSAKLIFDVGSRVPADLGWGGSNQSYKMLKWEKKRGRRGGGGGTYIMYVKERTERCMEVDKDCIKDKEDTTLIK